MENFVYFAFLDFVNQLIGTLVQFSQKAHIKPCFKEYLKILLMKNLPEK